MQSIGRPVEYRARPIRLLRIREGDPSNGGLAGRAGPRPENASEWARVHAALVDLGRQRAAHERDVCRWLLAAERLSVHARAGYASLREYAERVLGLKARQTEKRLRVGRALTELPLLDAALASGELAWSAVREITRVATRQTERAWLAWARPQRVHQIERAVAARLPGDGPNARPDPSRVKHRLAFEVRRETMALFRDLQAAVRADLGGVADEDAVLYEIARRALEGPSDDGRAASFRAAPTTAIWTCTTSTRAPRVVATTPTDSRCSAEPTIVRCTRVRCALAAARWQGLRAGTPTARHTERRLAWLRRMLPGKWSPCSSTWASRRPERARSSMQRLRG